MFLVLSDSYQQLYKWAKAHSYALMYINHTYIQELCVNRHYYLHHMRIVKWSRQYYFCTIHAFSIPVACRLKNLLLNLETKTNMWRDNVQMRKFSSSILFSWADLRYMCSTLFPLILQRSPEFHTIWEKGKQNITNSKVTLTPSCVEPSICPILSWCLDVCFI